MEKIIEEIKNNVIVNVELVAGSASAKVVADAYTEGFNEGLEKAINIINEHEKAGK